MVVRAASSTSFSDICTNAIRCPDQLLAHGVPRQRAPCPDNLPDTVRQFLGESVHIQLLKPHKRNARPPSSFNQTPNTKHQTLFLLKHLALDDLVNDRTQAVIL
jgi:hypothetical protein